jgi:hypothetical protein
VRAERKLVDREIVVEREKNRWNNALRLICRVAWHELSPKMTMSENFCRPHSSNGNIVKIHISL